MLKQITSPDIKSKQQIITEALQGVSWPNAATEEEDIFTAREFKVGNYLSNPSGFFRSMVVVHPNGKPIKVFTSDNFTVARDTACKMVAVLNGEVLDGTGSVQPEPFEED